MRYIQKPDSRPCSITDSVKRFPTEEATEGNATSPPLNPPTNLTVVTVEGCPSFVILDWEKPLNDTVTGKNMDEDLSLGWETLITLYTGSGYPGSHCDVYSISEEDQVYCLSGPLLSKVLQDGRRTSLSLLWAPCDSADLFKLCSFPLHSELYFTCEDNGWYFHYKGNYRK